MLAEREVVHHIALDFEQELQVRRLPSKYPQQLPSIPLGSGSKAKTLPLFLVLPLVPK